MLYLICFLLLSLLVIGGIRAAFAYLQSKREARVDDLRRRLTAATAIRNRSFDYTYLACSLCNTVFSDNERMLRGFLSNHDKIKQGYQETLDNLSITLVKTSGISFPKAASLETLEHIRIYLPVYCTLMGKLVQFIEDTVNEKLGPAGLGKALGSSFKHLKEQRIDDGNDDAFIYEWHILTLHNLLSKEDVETQNKIENLSEIANAFHHNFQNCRNNYLTKMIKREQKVCLGDFSAKTHAEQMMKIVRWVFLLENSDLDEELLISMINRTCLDL